MSLLRLLITVGLLVACLSLEFTRLVRKPWPPKDFGDIETEFKYGSINAEVNGYPFLIWRELPTIFKKQIPEGWRQFGFIFEENHEVPIGVSVRRVAVQRVGFNCATCHTSTVATEGKSVVLLGAPANQFDLQAYVIFLASATGSPRLTPEAVFSSAESGGRPIGWFDRMLIKYFVFPRLRNEIGGLNASLEWITNRPAHGPGRTDAGNFWRSRWGLRPENDEQIGTVDFPSVWNQRMRLGGAFHWDGNNSSLQERNYSAALAGGATEWLLARRSIGRISDWMLDLKSPPFPGAINQELAANGKLVFQREGCGNCHEKGVGRVTELSVVRTDPERHALFTPEIVARFHNVGSAYSWRFSHYAATKGYANMPLDGIWGRGPYLHNGSVPTLAALFSKESDRPIRFYRGCVTFDSANVGFSCQTGFDFDTRLKGNSNKGHEYGTQIDSIEKAALIEYLKTL